MKGRTRRGIKQQCKFNAKIRNHTFSLYKCNAFYGLGILIDNLYCFNLDVNFVESLFLVEQSIVNKRSAHNECYVFLWHQRLCHMSKERILRLVKSEILP